MKLRLVDYNEVRETPSHPLHSLLLESESVSCDDPHAVSEFYSKLVCPIGYYAMVTTSYGYWVDFYEPDVDQEYVIYHPYGGDINHDCKRGEFEYKEVAHVHARSLNDVFQQSQNDFNEEYASLGIRSTCVGDIIRLDDVYYMITGTGFVEVPPTVVQYIDWSNHVKDPTDLYNDQDYA